MAYDEKLANRIRASLARRKGFSERKMFGGIAFMLDGKMCCGVLNDQLVARVGPEAYAPALREPHVRPMDFTGRPMKGYVYVGAKALNGDAKLRTWIARTVDFARTLPAKKKKGAPID